MRRKLYFGVALATFGIVVGGLIFTHTIGAQDAPKKAEPVQKKSDQDLFDILRQKFEAKSDGPVLPPPNLPPPTAQAPAPMPIPPPAALGGIPGPTTEPKVLNENVQQPLPTTLTPPPNALPPVQDLPKPQPLTPLPTPSQVIPPVTASPPTQSVPLPKQDLPIAKTPVVANDPPGISVPQRNIDPVAPTPMPLNEPIKLKGSAWSLYVEMVNGQTVVTATVNKKHEFKIVCQHLDLQTGAGVMKAKGKVQISGDALNGSCDQLTLPLLDDRLVLEGAAEVRIQKVTTTTNVSDTRPAAFELKGDKLDLRIGELQSSAYIETSWRKVAGEGSEGRTIPASIKPGDDAKKWTPYGKLSNIKSSEADVWGLVGSDGKVIAYVMARDGGSLEQYVGRTIAVFGAREGERGGYPLVRVTHIAVP